MNDQMESTGKTVDEAIREALLRMGLRREEVDVTVIQEARSGLFGLGSRQAVVKVSKKSGRSRDTRGRRDERAEGSPDRRGRQRGERLDDGRDNRDGAGDQRRGGQRRGGGGRGARVEQQAATDKGDQRRGVRGGRDHRGGARRDDAAPAPAKATQEPREVAAAQQMTRPADRQDDQHDDAQDDGRSRRRRPRRRRKRADGETTVPVNGPVAARAASGADRADEAAPASAAHAVTASAATPSPAERPEHDLAADAPARQPAPATEASREQVQAAAEPAVERNGETPDGSAAAPGPAAAAVAAASRSANGGTVLVGDVIASQQVQPENVAEAGETVALLQRVAGDLMLKSGFASRVQVQPGEYHLVKLVVDDRSAAVLIGRYGNTVDAVEHLVEKIASKAAGERVRMNLDINNYRARREDALVQRARNAAAEVRNTAQPVALDPAGGRERRIVHLYIQDTGDLTTYTEEGPDGKFVVVCLPEQVPAEHRDRSDDEQQTAAPEIEVSAVIDVDAVSEARPPAEERSAD